MKAVVLCAGLGTRLGDLTRDTPKPMLPIGGEPLLAHTLRYLASYGFHQVAINLHFMPDMIVDYFGDGSRFGVTIQYSHEEVLSGTAGAVKNLERYFADVDDFLVVYGDLLVDQDLSALVDFHRETKGMATLLLHQRKGSNSIVNMDQSGCITRFVERPSEAQRQGSDSSWVNSGLQMLSSAIFPFIPDGQPSDLPLHVYIPLLRRRVVYGFPLSGYRCAIDSPERYAEAQAALAQGRYSSPNRLTPL